MPDILAITGAASGIGAAVSRAAEAAGWRVAGADATPAPGLARLDVTDADAVAAWIGEIAGLRGLVCCAGISAETPLLHADPVLFRRILDVNVTGSFLAAQAAARAMAAGEPRAGERGAIVLVASVSGLRGMARRVAYGASKAAVINMAQVMAIDLAPHGIRANAICPGPVETPMVTELHGPDTRAAWTSRIPAARYGRAEEVAEAALFLLDPARSAFVNGHALAVDGGFSGAGLLR